MDYKEFEIKYQVKSEKRIRTTRIGGWNAGSASYRLRENFRPASIRIHDVKTIRTL